MRLLVPLALVLAVVPACITESIRFEPPANFPASIESTPTAAHPLNRVITLVPVDISDGGTRDFQPFDLAVVVRDPDVDQSLDYLVYVDGRRGGGDDGGDVPRATSGDRRFRELTIRTRDAVFEELRVPGCHKIEVLVSEAFMPGTPVPVTAGDLGTAVWWVATAENDTDVVDMARRCPR